MNALHASGGSSRREGDETFLSLETVAEIYRVETVWLREIYDVGIFEACFERDATIWIGSVELDRVATVVRLREVCGADATTIALFLGT